MRTMLAMAFLALSMAAFSQQHGQDKKEPSERQNTGSESRPLVVKIAPTPKTQEEAKHEAEERDAKKRAEDRKQRSDDELSGFTGELAEYTNRLFWVGAIQAAILILQGVLFWRQETASKTTERAYLKASHRPPGVVFEEDKYWITVEVKNYGRTPAQMTNALFTYKIVEGTETAIEPDYEEWGKHENPIRAFLVANDTATYTDGFKVGAENIKAIRAGTKRLVVFGYVDYIDCFGDRHRAGYGRFYEPKVDKRDAYPDDGAFAARNNLYYMLHLTYNYDRRRKKGEGKDWGA